MEHTIVVYCCIVILVIECMDSQGYKALMFTDLQEESIKLLRLDTEKVTTLVLNGTVREPRDVAYDSNGLCSKPTVYCVTSSKIYSIPLDSPDSLSEVADFGSGWLRGITVDTLYCHLYVTDTKNKVIHKVDLSGSVVTDLTSLEGRAYGVAVAEKSGYVYWGEFDHDKIMKAPFDDPTQKEVVVSGPDRPRDVYVDEKSGMVYWTEGRSGKVGSASLDGGERHTLATITEGSLRYLTYFDGHLYATGISSHRYYIFDIFAGSYTVLLSVQTSEKTRPFGIVALQTDNETTQVTVSNNVGDDTIKTTNYSDGITKIPPPGSSLIIIGLIVVCATLLVLLISVIVFNIIYRMRRRIYRDVNARVEVRNIRDARMPTRGPSADHFPEYEDAENKTNSSTESAMIYEYPVHKSYQKLDQNDLNTSENTEEINTYLELEDQPYDVPCAHALTGFKNS